MNTPELQAAYAELKAKEKALKEAECAFNSARRSFVEALASGSVIATGDIVTCNGFSHTGKKMKIDRVVISFDGGTLYKIKATGRIIKADGTTGIQAGVSSYPIIPDQPIQID